MKAYLYNNKLINKPPKIIISTNTEVNYYNEPLALSRIQDLIDIIHTYLVNRPTTHIVTVIIYCQILEAYYDLCMPHI